MVLYHWTLSSFPSFQHQIERFLCHWNRKIESYKWSWNLISKKIKQKVQQKKEWYFVSNFVFRPPLLLTIISCSFLINFEWFQRLQMHYFKIYKTFWKSKLKETIVEELQLQNHTKHLWKNLEHNPFTLKKHILFIFH